MKDYTLKEIIEIFYDIILGRDCKINELKWMLEQEKKKVKELEERANGKN